MHSLADHTTTARMGNVAWHPVTDVSGKSPHNRLSRAKWRKVGELRGDLQVLPSTFWMLLRMIYSVQYVICRLISLFWQDAVTGFAKNASGNILEGWFVIRQLKIPVWNVISVQQLCGFVIYGKIFNRNVKIGEGANTKVFKSTEKRSSRVECKCMSFVHCYDSPSRGRDRGVYKYSKALFTVVTFSFALQYNWI